MSDFSVNPADLQAMAGVFGTASSDVKHLQGVLTSGADQPESVSVIGSGSAAASYSQTMGAWGKALAQLVSSLDTMDKKLSAAASVYEQTESGNTVDPAP